MFSAESVRTDSLDVVIPSDNFRMLPLNKFCVKRFFEIGFINSANIEDEDFIDRLVSLNKTKESITHVTFIDEKEVKTFLDLVAKGDEEFEFPPPLMQELKQFVEYIPLIDINDMETITEYQAYKLKFKLIQTMYEQYSNEVREMRRKEALSRELDTLAERKPTTKGKKLNEMKSTANTSTRSGKKQDTCEKEDYTEVELYEDDLVIDDISQNQVYFYIFRGINNIDVIKYLLKMVVKISFIIKVSEFEVDEEKHPNSFWKEYTFIRNCPCDYLQNIAVFKYQAPPHDDIEHCLFELTEIVKTLIDYKRLHFSYIQNLKIVNTKFTETFRSFPIYDKIMDSYPTEVITIPLIINSMLQEVQMKQDKTLKSQSINRVKPKPTRHKTTCPFNINSMIRQPIINKKETTIQEPTFKVYEKDHLNLTFKSYDNVGVQYVRDNLEVLKLLRPVVLARESKFEDTEDVESHTHDVVIPSEDEPSFTDDQTTHLINLLYLKNRFIHDNDRVNSSENELTKNLIVFDQENHARSLLPHCLTDAERKNDEPFVDHFLDSNHYEVLRPMSLHWAEILKPEVLYQYLLESELQFLSCDYISCQLTNSLIVRYHQNVNSFGIHTKVWDEYLRTPVGLGDFCRFTLIDDYDWLKTHGNYPQITYSEVAKTFEEHTAMYQYGKEANREYRSLLVPQIQYSNSDIRQTTICPCIEENVCQIIESCEREMQGYPEMSANLESILKDLQEYNNVVDFSEHCKSKDDPKYSYAAYNFGVTKFSIVGHTTDFISLDKVRVTVDTSRFCHENFKMTVKVSSEHNLVVIHLPRNRFSCHVVLSDGSLVVFSKPVVMKTPEKKPDVLEDDSKFTLLELEGALGKLDSRNISESEISQFMLQKNDGDPEQTVTAMDSDHYSSLNLFPIVGDIVRQSPKDVSKKHIKKDVDLLRRLQNDTKCFKVSRRHSKRTSCVMSKIPENEVSVTRVVKRIIDKPAQMKFCTTSRRKCIIKGGDTPPKINSVYDCTVTIPNGLTLRVIPSEIQKNARIIKQSYELEPGPDSVSDEKFRMFTHDGTLIVGKMDGSLHLLMSSGKEISFTKPTNIKDGEMFCRVKKDLTEGLIRKLFTRIMANQQSPEASEYYISRRSHLESKYTSISSCESFAEISKLPYSSVSMITMEGEKFIIKKGKLFKYQYSRHTSEINFQSEERYYKRDDGFSARLDRDGTQFIEFPDKTTIKTIMTFSEEPIRFSKKDKMGWILVSCAFLFEHPYYKPVFFDNVNSNIVIRINEFDTLNINSQGGGLIMRNSTQIDLSKDYLTFTKDCYNCNGQYKCSLFIEPLYNNKNLKEEKEYFVTVEDTYKKTFKADFQGNCRINQDYIHTLSNDRRCNHSIQTDHQRIFLIKNNLEGMILLNDKAASAAMKDSEEDRNIHHYNDERNCLIFVTISRNVFTKYNERFFGKVLKDIDISFGKFPSETETLIYQATRNLYSMFELDQIDGLMSCLKKFFQEEVMRELALSLSALKFHLSSSKFSLHSLSQIYPEESEVEAPPAVSLHEKLKDFNRKMFSVKKIMKMPLPNYFNSKFCTFVEGEVMRSSSHLRIQSPETEGEA